MQKLIWATVLFTITMIGVLAQEAEIDAQHEQQIDREHIQWIDRVMRSISAIEPGTRRKDLVPVLNIEGGLSSRSQRTYVYNHCPYIKVDVQFSPVGEKMDESPNDKIVKVSRPYLEYTHYD
jgi:hypothetical protein